MNINQPFLRNQRQFPYDDLKSLANQSDQAYIDVATKVNLRTIGTYLNTTMVPSGEQYFLQGSPFPRNVFRQVYEFTGTGNVPHGINPASIFAFINCYGEYTDGTNWYGVLYASSVILAGQVTFYLTNTNIVIQAGGGAPAITKGLITIHYISNL